MSIMVMRFPSLVDSKMNITSGWITSYRVYGMIWPYSCTIYPWFLRGAGIFILMHTSINACHHNSHSFLFKNTPNNIDNQVLSLPCMSQMCWLGKEWVKAKHCKAVSSSVKSTHRPTRAQSDDISTKLPGFWIVYSIDCIEQCIYNLACSLVVLEICTLTRIDPSPLPQNLL